ncbi:hypothetical protein E1B28_000587 [Marasmius oreades]|uniref:Mei2-like C-terminal RNA recognition motif domain-containing protein n=1 Tax=Marasmius oreades TaxID=181124 RepID=A0A9P7V1S9_9AGAR|nr:uncharacterized protein E1B28_000587 [Marasmius oreades]KAG7098673.1 hypothetical protein E1B28_000587 [Marasmius oreades]
MPASLPNIWLPPSSRPTDPMQLNLNKPSLLTPPLTPRSSLGSVATDPKVSRVLSVSPIPSAVEDAYLNFTLRISLKPPGGNPIHSVYRTSEENGRVVVLNDPRDAVALQQILKTPPKYIKQYLQDKQVTTAFLSVDQFVELCGPHPVADALRSPAFRISVVPTDGDPEPSVKAFLESKGTLCSFHCQDQYIFEAEYFNLNDTSALWDLFKASPVVTSTFTLFMSWPGAKLEPNEVIYSTTPMQPSPSYTFPNVPSPTTFVPPPPHMLTPHPFPLPPPLPHIMSPPPPPVFFHGPGTPPLPFQQAPMFFSHNGWYDCLPGVPGPPPPVTEYWAPAPPPQPIHNETGFVDAALANLTLREHQRHPVRVQALAIANTDKNPSEVAQAESSQPSSPNIGSPSLPTSTPKCNLLSIPRISSGVDTRTTIMVKNIPNKMNCDDLIRFIGGVVERRFDFVYLRMDFSNNCNFGYAFVNFITVEDLLKFAKAKLGRKWNMFQSEKVLEMCYANYQYVLSSRDWVAAE